MTGRPWDDLRNVLFDSTLPGRWLGYFAYDVGRLIEPGKLRPAVESRWPLIELAYCPNAELLAPGPESPSPMPCAAKPTPFTSSFEAGGYEQAVRRALTYIAAGDVFQVNLAQRLRFETRRPLAPSELRSLYACLAQSSPAWYGAHLELPDDRYLLCTSPELFLELKDQQVTTRPIKGTRPATQPAQALIDSAKDAAELHMIVDLMRNDLGRVCRYGSVRVDSARTIESHPTVHHGVATITGHLHERFDVVDLLRATLPGGSVTGAPKIRAMQIIDELEPVPRGPYCGAIGWISREALCLNVAIRTMVIDGRTGTIDCHVGAGIVADSDPAAEGRETHDKAAACRAALAQWLGEAT